MLPGRNEEYLLKFISGSDTNNDLLKLISHLGIKPKSREYNSIYRIIDELSLNDIFKKEALK